MSKCPRCGALFEASNYPPFCSERCKLIDLGHWAREEYRIPAKPDESDEATEPVPSSPDEFKD